MTIKKHKMNLQILTIFIVILSVTSKVNAIVFFHHYNVYLNDNLIASIEKKTKEDDSQFEINFRKESDVIITDYSENSWLPYELVAFIYRVDDGSRHSIKKEQYGKRSCCMDEMPAVSALYTALAVERTARLGGNLYQMPEISSKVCELENEICAISIADQWIQNRAGIDDKIPIFFMGKRMEDLFNQIIEEQIDSNSSAGVSASFPFMNSFGIQNSQQVQPFVHTLTFAPKCKLFTHKNRDMSGLINETNQRVTYQYKVDSEGKIINSVTVYDHVSHTSLLFSAVITNYNDYDQSQFPCLAEHQQLPMDILQQASSYLKDTNDSVESNNKCSVDEAEAPAPYARSDAKVMEQTVHLGGKNNKISKISSKVCESEKVSRAIAFTDQEVKKEEGITDNDMSFTKSCLNSFACMFIDSDNHRTKNHHKEEASTAFSEEIIKENSSIENYLEKKISVAYPEESQPYLLEFLPDELYEIICKKINLNDIISLSKVNNKMYKKTVHILYEECCRELSYGYSSQSQTLFKEYVKGMNYEDALAITSPYSTDPYIAKELLRKCSYFFEKFLYEIREIKISCGTFELEEIYSTGYNEFLQFHILSFDASQFMVHHKNVDMIIYERVSSNEWKIKQTITDSNILKIAISNDFQHMLVFRENETASIYTKNNSTIWNHNIALNKIKKAYFSNNGRNIITINSNETLIKLYRFYLNRTWVEEKSFNVSDTSFLMYTNCSSDGRLVSIVQENHEVAIYQQDSYDEWSCAFIANENNKAFEAKFSIDSRQIMLLHDQGINIYDKDLGNTWKNQTAFICCCGRSVFSYNDRHLLTITRNESITGIYNKDLNGIWSKKNISYHPGAIRSVKFSENNKYLVVNTRDDFTSVYVKDMNDNWMEIFQVNHKFNIPVKIINNRESSHLTSINHDGSQMIVSSIDQCMRIYGPSLNGKWMEKCSIFNHDGCPESLAFSNDGNYIITTSHTSDVYYSSIRIWQPCLTASNKTFEVMKKYILPYSNSVQLCSFSNDDRHIIIASNNGVITIYKLDYTRKRDHKKTFSPNFEGSLSKPTSYKSIVNNKYLSNKSTRKQTFSHAFSTTKLSADGHHLLSIGANGIVYICKISNNGYLSNSLTINKISSAYFSENSRNIIAMMKYDNTIKLYRLSLNEEWIEEYKIILDTCMNSTCTSCSADGSLVSIVDKYNRTTIYQQDLEDQWTKTVIADENHKALKANFSPDSRQVMIIADSRIDIYDKGLGNTWVKQITIICSCDKTLFSADGRHMLIVIEDANDNISDAKIYSKNLNGAWSEKHSMSYNNMITSEFNANSNYLMIIIDQRIVNIYAKDNNENWSIVLQIDNIYKIVSAGINADGSHILIVNCCGNAQIYKLDSNNKYKTKDLNDDDCTISAIFSTDGRQFLTIKKRTIRLWSLN